MTYHQVKLECSEIHKKMSVLHAPSSTVVRQVNIFYVFVNTIVGCYIVKCQEKFMNEFIIACILIQLLVYRRHFICTVQCLKNVLGMSSKSTLSYKYYIFTPCYTFWHLCLPILGCNFTDDLAIFTHT